jgi:hypothetical protein
MATDWADIAARTIALGAPILGAALGGPLGGTAGKILADALGVPPVPEAVGKAIDSDAAAVREAAQNAEAEWAKALADIGKTQVSEVGATMRAEIVSSDPIQKIWRPVYALELTLLECPAFALVLGRALWTGNSELINGFVALSGLLMAYLGARFGVLGVYVTGRSREKQAEATGQVTPSVLAEILKALSKKTR